MFAVQLKKDLRKKMLYERNNLDAAQKKIFDDLLNDKLIRFIQEKKPSVVHTYITMGSEINFRPAIEYMLQSGILVVAPQSLPNREMKNLILHSLEKLEGGIYNTSHPANSTEYTGKYDLIIVPGLAFDKQGSRLGYGAGYYDIFLEQQPDAYKIGLCYPFQLVENVPREEHDIPLDEILF